MLEINYCKSGGAFSDFEVRDEVARWLTLNATLENPDLVLALDVSTQNIVSAFRLAVANDQIDVSQIRFTCDGFNMRITEFGTFKLIPEEFTVLDNLLVDLVKQQSKKRQAKAKAGLHHEEPKPLYEHDCEDCTFIKSGLRCGRMVDYYICGKEQKTLVYRYSSEPSDNGAIDFLTFGADFDTLGEEYKLGYAEEYKIVADYHAGLKSEN